MSKTMYRAHKLGMRISAVEIIRETKAFVYLPSSFGLDKESKNCEFHSWHDTFDQAKSALIDVISRRIDVLTTRISVDKATLAKIESLTQEAGK